MTEGVFTGAKLPEQYHFTDKGNIQPNEIITLRKSVGWRGDTTVRWRKCIDQSLAVIGVRDTDSNLIGMACLTGNVRHAILCDLAVNPAHQHQGIGTAIMSELLKMAERIGVGYLYAELADTNPFRDWMIHSGFKVTGDSLFKDCVS